MGVDGEQRIVVPAVVFARDRACPVCSTWTAPPGKETGAEIVRSMEADRATPSSREHELVHGTVTRSHQGQRLDPLVLIAWRILTSPGPHRRHHQEHHRALLTGWALFGGGRSRHGIRRPFTPTSVQSGPAK